MSQARALVVAAVLTVGCTLDPDGVDGAFGSAGNGGDGAGSGSAGADDDDDDGDTGDPSGADESTAAADDGGPGDDAPGDAGDDGVDASTGVADGGDDAADDAADDGATDVGECSNFTSADQMFGYVNNERGKYGGLFGNIPHSRWKGYPWQGEGHENFTFPVQFAWDDGLAAQAQAEAEAIAAGASPQGNQQNGSNGLQICAMAPFWIDGIGTSAWRISFAESPSHWQQTMYESCPPTTFALTPDNQHARMGLHYHDFGGDGPVISKLGVGAALGPATETGECVVWWVLQFGP